jgi:hypothetical protein
LNSLSLLFSKKFSIYWAYCSISRCLLGFFRHFHSKILSIFYWIYFLRINFIDFSIFFNSLPIAIVLSSIYDYYVQKANEKPKKLFTVFSVFENYTNLVKINKNASVISCIDAIKVLSAIWICVGHRKSKNLSQSKVFFNGTVLKIISTFDIAVTSFFVCSAVLITISLLKALDRWVKKMLIQHFPNLKLFILFQRNQLNLNKVYFNRFIRFFVTMAALLLYLLPFRDNLPYTIGNLVEPCKKLKWKALFFVQNFGGQPFVSDFFEKFYFFYYSEYF